MRSQRIFPGLAAVGLLLGSLMLVTMAAAQSGPARVVVASDGTLYLLVGSNAWTLIPDQVSDAELATVNITGEIDGSIPPDVLMSPAATPVPPGGMTSPTSAGTPIALGTVISGSIMAPGNTETYTFSTAPQQRIYFQSRRRDFPQIPWQVVDSAGSTVFVNCFGCGDPGVKTLVRGGIYTLTVGSNSNTETGDYTFELWNVPPITTSALSLGTPVSGVISSPGAKQAYAFSIAPGQPIQFHSIGSDPPKVNWQVADAAGTTTLEGCFGCGDPPVKTLSLGGTYTLTVGTDYVPDTGAYHFVLSSTS